MARRAARAALVAAVLACACAAAAAESYVLITGGTVVNHDHSEVADVLIVGDKIARVGPPGTVALPADADADGGAAHHHNTKTIDARGKLVIPGGIDPHTHLAMPFMGHVACDDFYGGHRAALAGGTTWHIDFALPVAEEAKGGGGRRKKQGGGDAAGAAMRRGYKAWRAMAEPKAVMDYSFHMAVTAWSEGVAEAMAELSRPENGVNSFKFFMAYKGSLMVTDAELLQGFAQCRALQALAMVHAENGEGVALGQHHVFSRANITLPHGHALSRPKILEVEATARAVRLASYAGVPLYVVHVMAGEAAEEVARAQQRGERVVGEAVAAGIALDESRMWDTNWTIAAAHVMSPPIRAAEDRRALKRALQGEGGGLSVVATDHASFNSAQKRSGRHDFRLIPNGVSAIEERMHVAWTELVSRAEKPITRERFVGLVSANAAKIFGAYPRKGRVAEGSDADVVVFDPEARHVLGVKSGHSCQDVSVWEGYEAVGRVDVTISRGRVAWEGGRLRVPPLREGGGGGGGKREEENGGDDYDPALAAGTGRFVPLPTGGPMFEGMERRGLLSGGGGGGGGGEEEEAAAARFPAWRAEFPYGQGAGAQSCGTGTAGEVCAA